MTDKSRSASGGWHLQTSKLLVVAVIAATAATGALVVTILTGMPPGGPPPPGPNGMPPPPPDLQALAVFPIVTGFFVLSWLAVLIVAARDQILRRLRHPHDQDDIAALRSELHALLEEYGERRETDGYLNGMRTATLNEPPPPGEGNVRSIRRTPPR